MLKILHLRHSQREEEPLSPIFAFAEVVAKKAIGTAICRAD